MAERISPSAAADAIEAMASNLDSKALRPAERELLVARARVGTSLLRAIAEPHNVDLLETLRGRARSARE
jgi:hypothetical protein